MQPAHVSHILLLFFFSFVLASAALVQHGVKLPLSNKVNGSENIELLLYHAFCGEKFFLWRRFLLVIEFKFHHTMLVLNAFLAISEGFVSDNQGSPPPHPRRDLPLQPHLVCLLVTPHHPVKKNTWLRAWLLIYWAVRLNFSLSELQARNWRATSFAIIIMVWLIYFWNLFVKEWHFYRQFGIYLLECVFQKVSKLHELAIFLPANFKVSNRRFLHLIGYHPIKVLHSLRYLYFVSLFLHYQFPRFCTLSTDQIQEICPCILLESKLWVRSVLFL